jgi:hypothetical protein
MRLMSEPAPAAMLVARIEQAMAAGGLQPIRAIVGGPTAVVGSTSKFRWSWMATQLNTLIYAASFLPGTTIAFLDQYMATACQDAINRKGAMRGFQVGVAAVTVAAVDQATPELTAWAATPHGRRFAALTFPVLVDASTRQVVYPQRMVLGGIYTGYLKDLVRTYIEAPIRQ